MQIFDKNQIHFISLGKIHQQTLRNTINQSLFNNSFNNNYIVGSPPGMGKSHETQAAIARGQLQPVVINGNGSISFFMIQMATTMYQANGKHQVIVLDDCDMLFDHKNVNITKKMFDNTRALNFNKNFRSLAGISTEFQMEAMNHFSHPDSPGFSVPLSNATFLILTNLHLPTINEVESLDKTSTKYQKATDLHAIRRRTQYKEIDMNPQELWGYIAHVVLTEKICEKFIPDMTEDRKYQMLSWCYANWERMTERNLSIVEKMTQQIVAYPDDYLDIWRTEYVI